jgi:hypothetical protein
MSIKSTETSNVSVQTTFLALKVIKADSKSAGISAAGLVYNKV